MNRFFVPLNSEPFEDFKSGSKTYELRGYGRCYTGKHVYRGRVVELRKGYSGESLWGRITNVETGTLEEVLAKVPWQKIIPKAKSRREAIGIINHLLGKRGRYIAFEVDFVKGENQNV